MPRFEIAKGFEDKGINLPKRATKNAAGYDFEAAQNIIIPSFWKSLDKAFAVWSKARKCSDCELAKAEVLKEMKPTLVPTGIKVLLEADQYLELVNRSSGPLKRGFILTNGIGVVDSDYYGNPDNDGHIMFQIANLGMTDVMIKKGDRIGQGIIKNFYTVGDYVEEERSGGFGSTGE